ncbi:AsmA-like C-terminal region-containing protein [Bacteroides sp. UBA939]|uniref:AsmA family protein n=1 Tax=Bacteroides sp. UBA939 TaxID=1946092 RepID=UPI0025B9DA68|nr:AsmA-like C-terminal region-containing protein [Bacteroides sp. UBA939]
MEEILTEENKSPKSWNKILKKVAIILVSSILLLLIVLTVVAGIFQDKITNILLNQFYEYTKVEIKHEKVSFSMIRKFPMASLQINNINVAGPEGKSTLLKAEHIFLQFNLFDLVRNNYTIRRIDISNADLQLFVDKKGNNNWNIFNFSDSSKTENVEIKLSSIQLKNVRASYEDEQQKLLVEAFFNYLSAKGNFSSATFTAQLSSDAVIGNIEVDKIVYLSDQELKFYTKLDIDTENKRYGIEGGNFELGILNFIAHTSLSKKKEGYKLQSDLSIKYANIEKIIEKLPETIRKQTRILKPVGILSSSVKINGIIGKGNNLDIAGDFLCKNGSIENIENDIKFSKINLQGDFSLSTSNVSHSLKVKMYEFSGKLNNGHLAGKINFENLEQPDIDLSVNGTINLEDLHSFLPTNYFYKVAGNASIDIVFKNKFTQIQKLTVQEFKNASIQGNFVFTNVMLQIRENENMLETLSGDLQFNNQLIIADELQGKLKGNDFVLSGKIENMYPYILEHGNRLEITADLNIPDFDLNKLFATTTQPSSKSQEEMELFLPKDIDFNFSFKADKISFNHFKAENTSGKAVLKNNILLLENLNMNTCDGKMQGKGSLKQISKKEFLLNCNAKLTNINIPKLFYAFNNFGQNALTDKNIKGAANSDVNFTAVLGSNMVLAPNSISTLIDIDIKNGQLNNFVPLESLSKFVELSELQNVKFETLENHISIDNSTITIPNMEIKTNALNLSLGGNHRFSGEIDYHIRLMMKEILAKKVKNRKNREDFGEVIDDNTGTHLYLLATGTMENPKFKWDGQSSRKGLKEQFSDQKQQIQENRNQNNPQTPSIKEETKELNNSKKKQSDIELDEDW